MMEQCFSLSTDNHSTVNHQREMSLELGRIWWPTNNKIVRLKRNMREGNTQFDNDHQKPTLESQSPSDASVVKQLGMYHQNLRDGTDAEDIHGDANLDRWTCNSRVHQEQLYVRSGEGREAKSSGSKTVVCPRGFYYRQIIKVQIIFG